MFRNYQELFYGYVEFYQDSCFAQKVTHQTPDRKSNSISWTSSLLDGLHHQHPHPHPYQRQRQTDTCNLTTSDQQTMAEFIELASETSSTQNLSDATSECHRKSRPFEDSHKAEGLSSGAPAFNGLGAIDVLNVVTIFLVILFLRRNLSRYLKSSMLVKSCGLRQKDQERLDESLWRLLYYTFSSSWLLYSCFLAHQAQRLFDRNAKHTEYLFAIDMDEYLICMVEAAFYLHATYAIVFEDVWRRDSPMMLLHHLAAIFSMLGIYTTGTHRIGLATVVLRDTCDVLLEVTKICLCLRIQHGKLIKGWDNSVKSMLIIFTAAFVINQLYYYPLFCLYHALNLVKVHQLRTLSVRIILVCSLIFLILDLLWFGLILRLLYRMLFTNEPLKDLREYEEDSDGGSCAECQSAEEQQQQQQRDQPRELLNGDSKKDR